MQTYSLEAELECCLRTWAHISHECRDQVQRFDGRDLGQSPTSLCCSCKLGTSWPACRVAPAATPLPQAQIDFWGSEATADFERALCGDGQPSIGESPGIGSCRGKQLSRLGQSQCRPAAAGGGGPTRPGDQLRRFQPTDPDPDQLASATCGRRSLRADGRAPPSWGERPNSVSLTLTGIHQPFARYAVVHEQLHRRVAVPNVFPTKPTISASTCPGRNHALKSPCLSMPQQHEPPRSGPSKPGQCSMV